MSAVARDYAYQVKIEKNAQKPEPTISLDVLKQYQADVAKYLKREEEHKLYPHVSQIAGILN